MSLCVVKAFSLAKLVNTFTYSPELALRESEGRMHLDEVRKALDAEVLSRSYTPYRRVSAAAAADLMSDVLALAREDSVLLTGLANPLVIRTADVATIAAIVFVRGKAPSPETVRLAEESGVPLLGTQLTMFESCGRLYAAGLRGWDPVSDRYEPIERVSATGAD